MSRAASTFCVDWLDLREPADGHARGENLLATLLAWLPGTRPLRVLDLGCGTGANLRWLAPRLPGPQRWRLLDLDEAVLAVLPRRLTQWAHGRGMHVGVSGAGLRLGAGVQVGWQRADLARALPALRGERLVTASALADLVSRPWLAALAGACARGGAALLLALSYDGRVAFGPRLADDARVRDALNRHQLGDKGFGPGLGPGAAAAATALLRSGGWRVLQARSDWRIGPAQAPLAGALIHAWCSALRELASQPEPWLERWRDARLALTGVPGAALRVGHVDLLALPPG